MKLTRKQKSRAYNAFGTLCVYEKRPDDASLYFRLAIQNDPSNAEAVANLVRVTAAAGEPMSWLTWWSKSPARKVIAIVIGVSILLLAVLAVADPTFFHVVTTEVSNQLKAGNSTITTDTKSTSGVTIDQILIMMGVGIVILLFPELQSIKVGPIDIQKAAPQATAKVSPSS